MRDRPFVFYNMSHTYRGRITYQMIKNEYFYTHLELINQYMVEFNKTFEWKENMIKNLVSLCGWPVKLSKWQNFLANYLLM